MTHPAQNALLPDGLCPPHLESHLRKCGRCLDTGLATRARWNGQCLPPKSGSGIGRIPHGCFACFPGGSSPDERCSHAGHSEAFHIPLPPARWHSHCMSARWLPLPIAWSFHSSSRGSVCLFPYMVSSVSRRKQSRWTDE